MGMSEWSIHVDYLQQQRVGQWQRFDSEIQHRENAPVAGHIENRCSQRLPKQALKFLCDKLDRQFT